MKPTLRVLGICLAIAVMVPVSEADATTITFEGFAPVGSLVNINPSFPYTEGGFTLTPTNPLSAVFDSAAAADMPGNLTDFFGFQESNIPRLRPTGGGVFDLTSLLLGPNTNGGPNSVINVTITGHRAVGPDLTSTLLGLTTATTATLNWTNLTSVDFTATNDAGLDDIVVTSVPEPASLTVLALGLAVIAATRRVFR
jgi:PEP-CTERM motif-containing protein